MGRAPCCDEEGIKKGPWTPEEDQKLVDYIQRHGHGSWRALPKLAGLKRCGKSCRLRWTNYLRPDIKRGKFTDEEEQIIIKLHSHLGNKWSAIAARLPGRTDNEIKNYWNTYLKKKLLQMGIDPVTHKPRTDLNLFGSLAHLLASSNFLNLMNPLDSALVLQANAAQLERIQLLQNILRSTMTGTIPQNLEAFNLMGLPLLQDYHFNDLSRLNCQLDGLLNGSLGVVQNPTPIQSNLSNSGIQQPTYDYPALEESCVRFDGQQRLADSDGFGMKINNNNDNQMTLSCSISPTMPATTPVPSTPEFVDLDKLRNQVNPSEISNNSSTSTPFDAWGELNLEDQASDYCLNIINQPTSPSWPNEY